MQKKVQKKRITRKMTVKEKRAVFKPQNQIHPLGTGITNIIVGCTLETSLPVKIHL